MSSPKLVGLCVTCLVDQVMPEVGVATVRLLRRANFKVGFPQEQTCCGQPFFNSGFHPEAKKLAKRVIEIFSKYEAVVLPSGSCTTMIRVEYPHLLADEPAWHDRAQKLGAKTYELTEFLHQFAPDFAGAAAAETAAAEPTPTVTYHDSCHMCRLLNLKDEPREALTSAGVAIVEMEESDRCCGFGGLFSVRMPEVANAMSGEKLRQAAAAGAETLVTADPGCCMQLQGVAGDGIKVKHIATVLEESTRG